MFNLLKSFKLLSGVISLISCVCFSGCYTAASDSEMLSSDDVSLHVSTRSISGSPLQYPVLVYAFDQNGDCKAQGSVGMESEQVRMNLSSGTYRITALSGSDGFKMPIKMSQSALISTNDDNYSTTPLMMGQADVVLTGVTKATLQMSIQVSAVEVILNGIPDNVTGVTVSFASQFSKISLNGELSSPLFSSIDCTKENGIWKTGKIYFLPGSANTTVCTLSLVDETGVNTYGYTYLSPFKAGIPYILNGSFAEGFNFEGTIVSSGWDNEVVLDFNFGPGVSETGSSDNNENPNEDNVESDIPQPASMWKDFVVALVEKTSDKEADLLLISKNDWSKVSSANSLTAPTEAVDIEKSYSENGMGDWHIPSKTEAASLKSVYAGDNITVLNEMLTTKGYSPIVNVEASTDNARYLCEGAAYSFSLKAGTTSITEAGTSTKYHLRLVKKVHLTIE